MPAKKNQVSILSLPNATPETNHYNSRGRRTIFSADSNLFDQTCLEEEHHYPEVFCFTKLFRNCFPGKTFLASALFVWPLKRYQKNYFDFRHPHHRGKHANFSWKFIMHATLKVTVPYYMITTKSNSIACGAIFKVRLMFLTPWKFNPTLKCKKTIAASKSKTARSK